MKYHMIHEIILHHSFMTSTEYGWLVVNILLIMADINGYDDGFHDG